MGSGACLGLSIAETRFRSFRLTALAPEPEPLTASDAAAVDVGDVLTLAVPRTDDPFAGVIAPTSTGTNQSAALPSHLQRVHAQQLSQVAAPDHEFEDRSDLKSNEDYRAYIESRLALWKASKGRGVLRASQ